MRAVKNARVIEDTYSRELAQAMRSMGIDVHDLPFLTLIRRLLQYAAMKRVPRSAFPFLGHRTLADVMKDQEEL